MKQPFDVINEGMYNYIPEDRTEVNCYKCKFLNNVDRCDNICTCPRIESPYVMGCKNGESVQPIWDTCPYLDGEMTMHCAKRGHGVASHYCTNCKHYDTWVKRQHHVVVKFMNKLLNRNKKLYK